MQDEETHNITVDEETFYNHMANFTNLIGDFEPELDSAMNDLVNEKNVSEYHKIYKVALLNSKLKDLCKYNPKKKEFVINNSEKAREIFLKNLASALKPHFWSLGKGDFSYF
jgi:iron uptake system EfeUOB component EfeO/EfeM